MKITILLLYAILFFMPFGIGLWYSRTQEKSEQNFWKNYVFGFVVFLGVFEIFALAGIYLKWSLSLLTMVFLGGMGIAALAGFLWNRKNTVDMVKKEISAVRKIPWIWILAVLVILLQMYMYTVWMHTDDDDAFYLTTATTAVETDSLFVYSPYTGEAYKSLPARYVLSPFPLLYAVLSKVTALHPAIIAHTLIPAVFVLLAYIVYAMIGEQLFHKDKEKTGYFVLFISVLLLFSASTTHLRGMVFLVRIWQGKAVLASILIPLILYMALSGIEKGFQKKDYIFLFGLMLSCCVVSSMGIMLGAITLGITAILLSIRHRNWKMMMGMFLCCVPNMLLSILYLMIR